MHRSAKSLIREVVALASGLVRERSSRVALAPSARFRRIRSTCLGDSSPENKSRQRQPLPAPRFRLLVFPYSFRVLSGAHGRSLSLVLCLLNTVTTRKRWLVLLTMPITASRQNWSFRLFGA